MQTRSGNEFALLAEAFCYPAPGMLTSLQNGLETLPAGIPKQSMAAFLEKISCLSLGEWEELYTRTLDLNPPAIPYVGFQVWGESYQRGAFLAQMKRKLMETGVDSQGELPDHLIPVLRYLGQDPEPMPALVEALDPALQRMLAGLRKADSGNPYLDLLAAAQSLCSTLKKEAE